MKLTMYAGFAELIKQFGVEKAAQKVTELGFSSVELFQTANENSHINAFDDPQEAAEAQNTLRKYGLTTACYSVAANIVDISGSPSINHGEVDSLKNHAKIAAALGSPFFHHTIVTDLSLGKDAPEYCTVLPLALEAVSEIISFAHDLGLVCLYEEQGMYFNGLTHFSEFYSLLKTKHSNVGICGDIGNILFVDESPVPFFEKFAAEIKHVHVKDYFAKSKLNDGEHCSFKSRNGMYLKCADIGTGDIDIASCLKALSRAGYRGTFAIEDANISGFSSAILTLRKILQDNSISF